MQVALYIALGLLVAVAIGAQVWMLKTASGSVPEARRPLLTVLRWLNVALILVAVALVAYALAGR